MKVRLRTFFVHSEFLSLVADDQDGDGEGSKTGKNELGTGLIG